MRIVYADESGTSGGEKCYTIGALLVPDDEQDALEVELTSLAENHGVVGEVKWKKVSSSHGLINFGIDGFRRIAKSACCFNAIVVNKALYGKWSGDKEEAFYTTCTLLLQHCAGAAGEEIQVNIDNRQDSYEKRTEVVEIIGNHMLAKLSSLGRLSNVTMLDSKTSKCMQVTDFLTGAINHAHHRFLNPDLQMSNGKKLFIARLAQCLGWNDIIYDTYPNLDFNIWHFPIEWRAVPATKNIRINLSIPYVTAEDLSA